MPSKFSLPFKWLLLMAVPLLVPLVVFTRGISQRLSTLIANLQRLAQGRELTVPVEGSEEIAETDQSFRQMAQSHEELLKRSRLLQSTLENLADGVVVADEAGKFLLFNPAAERIMGVHLTDSDPDDWSHRYNVFLPDQTTLCPAQELPLARAIRGEEVNGAELFIRHPDQDDGAWITVTARPLIDDRGQACGGAVSSKGGRRFHFLSIGGKHLYFHK